jgi:hypothetical protein
LAISVEPQLVFLADANSLPGVGFEKLTPEQLDALKNEQNIDLCQKKAHTLSATGERPEGGVRFSASAGECGE